MDQLPLLTFQRPVTPESPDLTALLDWIGEGVSERDRERQLPYDLVSLIRSAKLGALRLPLAEGGGGPQIVRCSNSS